MSTPSEPVIGDAPRHGAFQITHWSLVAQATDGGSTQAQEALARLCETYWHALYAYIRRKGHSPEDTIDLTQEYFARLLAKNYLRTADRAKGKFRSFLLASVEHFLAKEWTRAHRQKRGGGQPLISLDAVTAEERYKLEPVDNVTPAQLFDRAWAMALLDRTMQRLRDEQVQTGKQQQFDAFKNCLTGDALDSNYSQLAESVGMTEGAVKVAIHRLRRRYADLLRDELAQTLTSPADVDTELRYLFSALRTA